MAQSDLPEAASATSLPLDAAAWLAVVRFEAGRLRGVAFAFAFAFAAAGFAVRLAGLAAGGFALPAGVRAPVATVADL